MTSEMAPKTNAPQIPASGRKIEKQHRLRQISHQSGIIFAGKIFYQLIMFITGVILARMLGATLLGQYQIGMVTIQITGMIAIMGFDRGLVKFIPVLALRSEGQVRKMIDDNILISLGTSGLLGMLIYFNAGWIAVSVFKDPAITIILEMSSIFLPVLTMYGVMLAAMRGFKRADLQAYVEFFITPILFVGFLGLVSLGKINVATVIIMKIIATLLGLGVLIYFYFRYFRVFFNAARSNYNLGDYFRYSMPLLLVGALYMLIGRIDMLMLGYFTTSDQVGIYGTVTNLAVLIVFSLQSVNTIFSPNIAELYELGDVEHLSDLLKTLTRWIFYISLAIYGMLVILGPDLLRLYGEEFIVGYASLLILAFGQLMNALAGSTGSILLMTGHQRWEVYNSLLVIILNIILNYFMIPVWGISGAAIASAISITVVNMLKVVETWSELKIHPYSWKIGKGAIAIALATLIGGLIYSFALNINLHFVARLALISLLMAPLSVFMLYLFGLDEDDRIILEKLTSSSAGARIKEYLKKK